MLALGLLLNIAGIGVFCWLIFTLAVYALPFLVAINAGTWAFHNGGGLLGTPLVAVVAGGITLAMAQIAFGVTRSLILCAARLLPCSLCRPHLLAIISIAQIGGLLAWQEVFACLGAVFIDGTAWMRLAILTEPGALEPGRAVSGALTQFSRPQRARDDLLISSSNRFA
jgi:hypothetical protein